MKEGIENSAVNGDWKVYQMNVAIAGDSERKNKV
jgi:hypothetical protein